MMVPFKRFLMISMALALLVAACLVAVCTDKTLDVIPPVDPPETNVTPPDTSAVPGDTTTPTVTPPDTSTTPMDTTGTPKDTSKVVTPPKDTSTTVIPPKDTSTTVTPPKDTSTTVTPPKDTSTTVTPPKDTSTTVIPPKDTSTTVTPPKDTSKVVNPPDDPPAIAPIGCTRDGLTAAVDLYLQALEAGDHTLMPLTASAKYVENDSRSSTFGSGLWKSKVKPDFHRNLIDLQECATFTEIIAAKTAPQYVIGTRLKVSGSEISEVYAVVTNKESWGFNADDYLKYSQREDWSIIPANERLPREELRRGAYAYFEYWSNRDADVPWGVPCARLEGGMYTGDFATSKCDVGIPEQSMVLRVTSYLADVDYGMVVLFLNLGGADTHLFRILKTGYRYIHTLTDVSPSDVMR